MTDTKSYLPQPWPEILGGIVVLIGLVAVAGVLYLIVRIACLVIRWVCGC